MASGLGSGATIISRRILVDGRGLTGRLLDMVFIERVIGLIGADRRSGGR